MARGGTGWNFGERVSRLVRPTTGRSRRWATNSWGLATEGRQCSRNALIRARGFTGGLLLQWWADHAAAAH
jgi:hypothetical protein